MFGVGFDREVFSIRHPSMGFSFSQLETYWKQYYPQAKAGLKPLTTQQIPGTNLTTQVPVKPVAAPSSGGSSALLWVGGLAILGAGAYYFLADRPFGMRKGKK